MIRRLAIIVVENLRTNPCNSSYFNYKPLPMLSAGMELTSEDADQRFRELHSFNHVLPTYWALND